LAVKNSRQSDDRLNERLAARGFRFTSQREHVYNVLLRERDHPTAEQVFMRSKKGMPDISMATVYNCLDTLVKSGLVREVNLDRSAMRYCPNMQDHCHFYCDECGAVYDIDLTPDTRDLDFEMPKGFRATGYEVSIHGACPKCGTKKK
jgi:Fur family peroxide stress response transcriptional regulator